MAVRLVWRLSALVGLLALIGGAFAAGLLWNHRPEVRRPINTRDQPTLGKASAPVQVVVFADFKCPFCARYEHSVYPELKSKYIDTGKVAYSFVNLAFLGPDSEVAARAGECVYHQDERLFWPFSEAVYARQGNETAVWATPETLATIATTVPGVDVPNLRSCLSEGRYAGAVAADRQLAEKLGVQGTPDVFVDGVRATQHSFENIDWLVGMALGR